MAGYIVNEIIMTTEPTAATSTNITEQPAATVTPMPPAPETPSIAAPPDVTPPWVQNADYAILALVLVLTFFLASFTASNSDLWLNLAIGQRLSEGTLEFGVDPFSWATEAHDGKPAVDWVNQSWLFSWLLFQLYQLVGGEGLVFVKALLMVAAVGILSRIGWRESSRWFIVITLAMAALAMSARLALQPLVVSLLCLSLTLYVLHRAGVFALRKDDEHPTCPRWLMALPPLFALWANLDHWFILGPIIVGLCWLASGLARFFKARDLAYEHAGLVPGKMLGLVFAVSLAACLLNPFHVRAFQLPPELAYLVLSITDSIGLALPDALVAGGRTLKEIRRTDPELATWTISSLSSAYWQAPQRGLNVAGLALYPLLLLGLLAFTLVSLIRANTLAPTLHLSRFLIWLFFGVMGLALYRMIPFFVIVAAPLTAMTLAEFLRWQQVNAAVAVGQRDRGLNLARFVTIPFMLLLIYLAWPGWLHGTTEFNSARRVAWQIRPDPYQEQAALAIKALKDKGECGNVFNTGYEIGNYLAWFAPDVKYGMDTRFSLYANRAADIAKARQALSQLDKPESDWQPLFETHKIDQLVLSNYVQTGIYFNYWLQAEHWRQRYIDTRSLVLSWSGPKATWPAEQLLKDLNRLAFGEVPPDERPPQKGTPSPQIQSYWSLYADGIRPQPAAIGQYAMRERQFLFQDDIFNRPINKGGPIHTLSSLFIPLPLAMPGGTTVSPSVVFANQWTMYPPRDFGPPALPILMVRAARRAVAENSYDPQAHVALIEAIERTRRDQEDRWINYDPRRGGHPAKLRDRLRQLQLVAGLYNVVQLTPEQFAANDRLAQVYLQQNQNDLALEHMQIAEKALETHRAEGKEDPKQFEAFVKQYRDKVKTLDSAVKVRLSKWKENSGNLPPMKQAEYAYGGAFQDLVNDRPVQMPLGLGKKALEILLALNMEKLDPNEQIGNVMLRFEILLARGQADLVLDSLKDERLRKVLPPLMLAQYLLLAGGAAGDYEAMEQGAVDLEAMFAEAVRIRRALCVPSMLLTPSMQSPATVAFALTLTTSRTLDDFHLQNNELCNLMTLRGILALEAGNTKKARAIFQDALDHAGPEYGFTERPIALRYVELLKEQKR